MFMLNYRSVSWRYFVATVGSLTAGMAGFQYGFFLAIAITVLHLIHFAVRERSLSSFPLQVRWGVLVVLLLGQVEGLLWVNWIPTVGLWVQCLFGYCTLARIVAVMPWNAKEPLSGNLLRRAFLTPPTPGNALQMIQATRQTSPTVAPPAA